MFYFYMFFTFLSESGFFLLFFVWLSSLVPAPSPSSPKFSDRIFSSVYPNKLTSRVLMPLGSDSDDSLRCENDTVDALDGLVDDLKCFYITLFFTRLTLIFQFHLLSLSEYPMTHAHVLTDVWHGLSKCLIQSIP